MGAPVLTAVQQENGDIKLVWTYEEDVELFVYYGGFTTQTIQKRPKSDLSTLTDETPDYGGTIYTVAEDDDFIYYGGFSTRTIQKRPKSDLSTLTDETPSYGGTIWVVAVEKE